MRDRDEQLCGPMRPTRVSWNFRIERESHERKRRIGDRTCFTHRSAHQKSKKMNSQPHRSLRASIASHGLVGLLLFGAVALHAQEGADRAPQMTNPGLPDPNIRSSKQGDTERLAPPAQPTTRMIIEMTTGEMRLTPSPVPAEAPITRWFELETASISSRYHFLGNVGGTTTANGSQYQVTFKGRFNFDESGKYNLEAGLFSGNSFTVSNRHRDSHSGRSQERRRKASITSPHDVTLGRFPRSGARWSSAEPIAPGQHAQIGPRRIRQHRDELQQVIVRVAKVDRSRRHPGQHHGVVSSEGRPGLSAERQPSAIGPARRADQRVQLGRPHEG